MNVLIIPEDFRKDQYIVRPIIRRMLAEIGKGNANVRVCLDPLMGGVSEATKWERIQEVLVRYRGMVQLFLLLVDRDGLVTRRQTLDSLEVRAESAVKDGAILFAENAWQEIEVWALAGQQQMPSDWKWGELRAEIHVKERYFEPLAEHLGLQDEPGGGRTSLGREAAKNYPRVRSLCKEDIESLERRIRGWLSNAVRS